MSQLDLPEVGIRSKPGKVGSPRFHNMALTCVIDGPGELHLFGQRPVGLQDIEEAGRVRPEYRLDFSRKARCKLSQQRLKAPRAYVPLEQTKGQTLVIEVARQAAEVKRASGLKHCSNAQCLFLWGREAGQANDGDFGRR